MHLLNSSPSCYGIALLMLLMIFPYFASKKQLIERILDFSRHQITDCMAASNPTFRALYKPSENVANDGNVKVHIPHADISIFGFS
jgi:hypothetical protein